MAVFSVRYLFLAASLLFVATLCTAQDPPRTCFDTGLTCINDCVGQTDGVHQWCGDCNYYVSCNGDIAYIQPCPADTYYSDDVQACVADSNTCTECYIYAGSTTPPPATPPVDAICGSTGPECIDHCDQTNNGIYQWCGRCDYFIQCSGSSSYWTECQPGLEYDHTVQACVYNSTTCTQSPCYDDLSTTPAPNVCTSSPCAFGGTCIQIPGGDYECICAPGYTGFNCSQVINYCNSNPCVNGATCLPIIDGYVCQCPPGYTGPLCQYVINNCQSLPCMNGGTCHNQIDGYVCVCPPEWTGERCNTLVDPCGSLPCINGGTCVNNCGFPQCICPPGWTGVSCDTYVDNCASDPCQNGGSCQNGLNQWTCICPPSFTGTRCESVVDICTSLPCQNGGTCVFDCGIYQCVCPDGWTGYNCQTPLTACDPTNPCYNGGTCIPNGGSFTCACTIDFTGYLCESPNYEERLVCGSTLEYSGYEASNGFTRLCFWYAAPNDLERRAVECRFTIHGIPLYDDYTGLLTAGGNFGCIVSQNYPDDLPGTSLLACSDYYQHDVSLGPYNESTHLMVCLRYPYEGIPDPGEN